MRVLFFNKFIYTLYQSKYGLSYGIRVMRILDQLRKTEKYSIDELREVQTIKFKKLVTHVYDKVPYYREKMKKIGILPEDIKDIHDINHFPVLTKKEIKDNYSTILSSDILKRKAVRGSTGGTTGEPLIFYRDLNARLWTEATLLRGMSWAKYDLGFKGVDFRSHGWPSLLGKIRGRFINCHYFPAFSNDDDLLNYFNRIRELNPHYLTGYSSNLFRISSILKKNAVNDIKIPVILSTAEMLYDYQRDLIEDTFNGRVYDYYGCNEIGAMAFECEKGSKHISDEHVIIETTNFSGNHVHGLLGEITITDLDNYVMPFIRYKNGDIGQLSSRKCTCNRELTLLEKIDGRTQEFLKTCNGNYLPSIFFPSKFRNLQGIEHYQIIQTDINNITLKIVKNSSFSDVELDDMIRIIKKMIGDQINVTVEVCTDLPLTGRGKRRLIITHVPIELNMASNQ